MGFAELLKSFVEGFAKRAGEYSDRQEKAFDRYMEKKGYNKDDD